MTKLFSVLLIGSLAAAHAMAQMAISAKSGLISYIEGRVLLGQESVAVKSGGRLSEVKPEQTLRTEEGRAEILLTPGVILRLGENSAVKMIANRLEDTRVELTSGSAVVEATEIDKAHAVTLLVGQASVGLRKMALLSLNAQAGIRMFKGEAQIIAGGEAQILREGRQLPAATPFAVTKFDKTETDPLYRWANRRSEIVAMANIASARTLQSDLRSGSPLGLGFQQGGWFYNPYFGMFTYIPLSGMLRSPFGFFYYSPGVVNRYYNQVLQAALPVQAPAIGGAMGGPRFDSNLGYTVNTRGGMAGVVPSAPVSGGSAGVPAAAAPAPSRGDAGGGVRGGGGGGSAN
jgi:hypothetical protein